MIEYCSEVLNRIESGISISAAAFKIGECAITGMLYEAGAAPKPGLVTPCSKGIHNDMDYFTFLKSTSSIAYSMYLCAQIGIDYKTDLLRKIRSVGIAAEKNMFRATGGINTQKGLLFASGVVCAAAGNVLRDNEKLSRYIISRQCSIICEGLVDRELSVLSYKPGLSNGEKLFISYGVKGIRGEAEKGFLSVIEVGLPIYESALKTGVHESKALTQCLLGLMTVVEDTVVINKKGLEGLDYMRKEAGKALALGGMLTTEGEAFVRKMEKGFLNIGISPGGAADLLALTVMIHELEKIEL